MRDSFQHQRATRCPRNISDAAIWVKREFPCCQWDHFNFCCKICNLWLFFPFLIKREEARNNLPTNNIIFIICWDFLIFYQFFVSPQVKRCSIITYKYGIYELPHELRNDLRLMILGNLEILEKSLNFIER